MIKAMNNHDSVKVVNDQKGTPAKRPAYSVLCKEKIQKTLGIRLPFWKDSLSTFLKSELFDKERIE